MEKHFTSSRTLPGPDNPISIEPHELFDLINGTRAIHEALGGSKSILQEEKPTIDFAYASVVTIKNIAQGELLTLSNIWVKRPGTGQILAGSLENIIGRKATRDIPNNSLVTWDDIDCH